MSGHFTASDIPVAPGDDGKGMPLTLKLFEKSQADLDTGEVR